MRAKIKWKTKSEGGRSKPPPGGGGRPYITIVRLLGDHGNRPGEVSWSFSVDKIEAESSEYEWVADVEYLHEEAPRHELRPGRKFELYDGKRCVATGILQGMRF